MELYYAAASLFLIVFFPRVLTRACCYDRINDKYRIRRKSQYYLIYAFWTVLFMILSLMMGWIAHADDTFGKFLNVIDFKSGKRDYVYGETLYDEKDYKYKGDFTWVCYLDNEVDLVSFMEKEIDDKICGNYNINVYKIKELSPEHYVVEGREHILADVTVIRKWYYTTLYCKWSVSFLTNEGG